MVRFPLKVVAVPSPPAVNVAGFAPLLVTLPLPANEPTLLEKPPRSRRNRVYGEGRTRTKAINRTCLKCAGSNCCNPGISVGTAQNHRSSADLAQGAPA